MDENNQTIPGFGKDRCVTIKGDSVKQPLQWTGSTNLATLMGKPVRFRFFLSKGHLYSFWVSRDVSGTSQGFVAAGSPDYPAGAADQ